MLCPAHTATRHRTIESPTLLPAWSHFAIVHQVQRLQAEDEKMVYPPQIPTITNWRAVVPRNMRPSGPVSVRNKPVTNDPRIDHRQ
jgi:hypothetical protein